MQKTPLYLVPFDFSPISDNALELSLELARANDGTIFLLHVVKSKADKTKIRRQFENVLDKLSQEDRDRITTNSIVGNNIYEEVGRASDLLRPSLVVMGTHGAKGIQKIFGSHIEKMISNSSSPILVTRGEKKVENIKRIIMPFSYHRESLQITKFASAMAKKFDACMHLVGHHDNIDVHEEKIRTNQIVMERFMKENNVRFKIVDLPMDKAFDKELMDYAGEVQADVIAAAYSNDTFMHTTNSSMQDIIENIYKIPVLTVNAEELTQTYY
jgi:nucleotide-binding universal stress UspA family protein